METSPACTELETHVLDWLVDMLHLPAAFRSDADGGGVIQDTASSASLCALIAARERAAASGVLLTKGSWDVVRFLQAYYAAHEHIEVHRLVRALQQEFHHLGGTHLKE